MTEPSAKGMAEAAEAALAKVTAGMRVGLGTGRSAEAFMRALAARTAQGLSVRAVVTSARSEAFARERGIPLVALDAVDALDAAFDGADEVAPKLDLTKGLGGALLRERVVAHMAAELTILVTPDKLVSKLGARAPIPVEVVPFAVPVVVRGLEALGVAPRQRRIDDAPYRTDNGNAVVDVHTDPLDEPSVFDAAVRALPGVVDTGLFLGMADEVIVGHDDGVERLVRQAEG